MIDPLTCEQVKSQLPHGEVNPAMSLQRRLVKILWKWVAPVAGLTAIALAIFFYFHSPGPKSYRLRMTAGNPIGMRHQLATRLQEDVKRQNLTLVVVPSAGSEEALDWVNSRQVDAALVQGGLSPAGRPNVREVAALHVEPMQLLVKNELFKETSTSLTALRGKTVDLSEIGSGTHALATAILEFAGLRPNDQDPAGGYIPLFLNRKEMYSEQDTARLPDAVFLLSTLPSPTSTYLVTRHGFRLVPLPFAEAFALSSLAEPEVDKQQGPLEGRIVKGRIQSVSIPAFTYSVEPAVPDRPIPTLGARLLLVAHKDVPSRAALQLVEATYGTEFGQIVRPPLDPKLMDLPPEFPWHDGAVLYQQRNAPVLSGEVMDSTHKGAAIFAAAASGLFVLWQWFKQYRQGGPGKGFQSYIAQVTRIEEQIIGAGPGPPLALPELLALRHQLGRIKIQALDEFARGGHSGKELLAGFLVQINDVRDRLARLIQQKGGPATEVPLPVEVETTITE
jgi:TRAP-type uncharacterized transport system substrate-binding protein